MSDSLLNLLEILDEVVAEQESGGAPTEDQLWNIVSKGLTGYLDKKLPPENGEPNQDNVAMKAKLTNPEERFYYAFGLLEWRLRNEEKKRELLRELQDWQKSTKAPIPSVKNPAYRE